MVVNIMYIVLAIKQIQKGLQKDFRRKTTQTQGSEFAVLYLPESSESFSVKLSTAGEGKGNSF